MNNTLTPSVLQGVKKIIAVASGKGGVGKSSIALSLALSLKKQGLEVAILDADIYGPSLPTLIGLNEKPEALESKKIIPLSAHGMKCMSMGFLVPSDTAIIWRGLMVQSAMNQMLFDVLWGYDGRAVDVLVIDMPPGTGDVALTMAQKVKVDGAVIVTTPQELALIDARRAIKMFEKVNIKCLGVIENMSHFQCSKCGNKEHIFAKNGGLELAKANNIPLLAQIPVNSTFRDAADIGKPFVIEHPEHHISTSFIDAAKSVSNSLGL